MKETAVFSVFIRSVSFEKMNEKEVCFYKKLQIS